MNNHCSPKNTFLIAIILLMFCWPSIYANEHFYNLGIQNGLAHTDANCVAQDSTGLIWIGTNAGLQSYDGYQLQTINFYPPNQKIYKSHNRINAMECGKNRLWIGTDSGLTCLDLNTHLYIPYTIIANDHNILNERIIQLTIDNVHNRLWIRSISKLYAVQIEESTNTLRIIEWKNDFDQNIIWSFFKPAIHQGDIWTISNGFLTQLTIENSRILIKNCYELNKQIKYPIDSGTSLFTTNKHLYLRSGQGCYRFNFIGNKLNISNYSFINFHQTNPNIPMNTAGAFIVDKDGTLWCSYFGGVFEVNHPFGNNKDINLYLNNIQNVNHSHIRISSLLIDKFNNLWIPTACKGAYYRSLSSTPFHYLSRTKFQVAGFTKNEISSIIVQNNKVLWMIVEGGSIFQYDIAKEELKPLSLPLTKGAADGLQTVSLSNDQQKLYIGSSKGVIVYEINTGKSYWLLGGDSKLLPKSISISRIKEDKWGRLWLGSWGDGIYCIQNLNTVPSIAYYLNPRGKLSILSNFITDLQVENKTLLLCTTEGINKIWMNEDGNIQTISTYQADETIPNSMSSNYIACIAQQNDSTYWIGTIGGGTNRLVIHSSRNNDYSANCYTENEGLTNNDSEIIYIDKEQNVWIGGKGIIRLNARTSTPNAYSPGDGLLNNSFKIGSGCQADDGTIYMGSADGLCYFNPKDFDQSTHPNQLNLILSDLYINNQCIIPQKSYEGNIPLSEILNQTRHFNLTHQQNSFAIAFAALGYPRSNQIMYRYRMVGFDKKWQIVPYSVNKAYYSNLPYGNYTFELQVSTDRGTTWIEPAKVVKLSILPPWWWTGWAKLLYALLTLTIITVIIYQYHKEQKLIRENHIKQLERINEEERYQSKMRFFMNISHELKTPLTLIMLSAEKLMDSEMGKSISAIWNNSKKMLALISELTDIRKADLGINKLLLTHQDIHILVTQLYSEIKPWAEKKEISITYTSEMSELKMDFDWDKIGKLIINLLSNAVKYTPKEGSIQIILKKATLKDIEPLYLTKYQEGEIQIDTPACIFIVRDTGVGISPDSIRHIYERFFQVNSTTQSHLGTGIGLAIAKTMVLLHKGAIIVSSERTVGTEFIVALPIENSQCIPIEEAKESSFNAKEFIDNQYLEYSPLDVAEEKETTFSCKDINKNTNLPILLIVEDNIEMQNILKEQLQSQYQIHIANNGIEGLETCRTILPDIIVSDIMMPEMDGVEMCKQIRNDLSIAFIPIILLTAKGSVEHQIEGYESGADLYIPKPFSIKLLTVNIVRLLKQKERYLKEEFVVTQAIITQRNTMAKTNEETWKVRLDQVVKENISNPDLSVDFICEKLFMSRSSLYNKMKECNHQPLADYIRNIRLAIATDLLLNSSYTINEIVMEVGFVNTSHFARIFKTKYGMTPSEYKKQSSDSIKNSCVPE